MRPASADMSPAQAIAQRMRAMEAELQQARQALRRNRKRSDSGDRWGLAQSPSEDGHEDLWFLTYLDMMTLMLVAMVVMLAFSGAIGRRAASPDAHVFKQPAATAIPAALPPIPAPADDYADADTPAVELAFAPVPPEEPVLSPLAGTFPDFAPPEPPAAPAPETLAASPDASADESAGPAPLSALGRALRASTRMSYPMSYATMPAPPSPDADATAPAPAAETPSEGAALAATLPLGDLGHDVEVIVNKRSISFRINSEILFGTGQADLSRPGLSVLQRMAKVLSDAGYDITVEGHTDGVPVRSNARYPSNWELSSARAGSVVRYLQANGIDKRHLKAVGYGDARPIADNGTADGRARNRRVELVVEKPHPDTDRTPDESGAPADPSGTPAPDAAPARP